jgi:hypothetical protein
LHFDFVLKVVGIFYYFIPFFLFFLPLPEEKKTARAFCVEKDKIFFKVLELGGKKTGES